MADTVVEVPPSLSFLPRDAHHVTAQQKMQLSTTDEIRRDDGGRRSKEEESGKWAVEAEGAVIQESGRSHPPDAVHKKFS